MWDTLDQYRTGAAPLLDQLATFLLTRPSDTTSLAAMLLVPIAAMAFYAVSQRRRFRFKRMLAVGFDIQIKPRMRQHHRRRIKRRHSARVFATGLIHQRDHRVSIPPAQ